MTEPSTIRIVSDAKLTSSTLAVAALLFSALLACNQGVEKVPEANVDAGQKALAEKLGTKIHASCTTGKFEALGDEATPAMKEGLSPEKQKSTCESLKGMFGDFQSMTYAETWKLKGATQYLYRFKGKFSKSSDNPEIRVVLDEKGKLAGLWIKPWADTPG